MNLKKCILFFYCIISFTSCSLVYGVGDVVSVGMFFETYGTDGESQELERFRKDKRLGPVARDFIKALQQEVDVVIASAPLVLILKEYIDNIKEREKTIEEEIEDDKKKRESIEKKIEGYRKLIETIEEGIEKYKKDMLKESIKEFKEKKELIKEWIESEKEWIKTLDKDIEDKSKKFKKDISFIKNKEYENYVSYASYQTGVFVYKKGKKELGDYGLDEDRITEISFRDLETEFKEAKPFGVNVLYLNSIFKSNDDKIKIVYVTGHGSFVGELFEERIAQMDSDEYRKFINEFLPGINCKFLFVSSCYAYSLKTEVLLRRWAKLRGKEVAEVKIPIAMGAISDSTTIVFRNINFKAFFEGMGNLFSLREAAKSGAWISRRPFEDILRYIAGPDLEDTVLIKFPGVRQFFRPSGADDKVVVITYPYLLAHGLGVERDEDEKPQKITPESLEEYKKIMKEQEIKMEEYEKKRGARIKEHKKREKQHKKRMKKEIKKERKKRKKEKRPRYKGEFTKEEMEKLFREKRKLQVIKEIRAIKARKSKESPIVIENKVAILLYPTILLPTIEIVGSKVPSLVSMFLGQAHHFINKIVAKDISFKDLIKGFFGKLKIKSKKLFLIGEIECQDGTIKNCVIETIYDYKEREALRQAQDDRDEEEEEEPEKITRIEVKYMVKPKGKRWQGKRWIVGSEPENLDYTKDDIVQQLSSLSISKEAYMEATGGIENEQTFRKALKWNFGLFDRLSDTYLHSKQSLKKAFERHFGPFDQTLKDTKDTELSPKKIASGIVTNILKLKERKQDEPVFKFIVKVGKREVECHVHHGKKEIIPSKIKKNHIVDIEIFPSEPTKGRIIAHKKKKD